MTLGEIKYQAVFQLNADVDDMGDYEPHLIDYINEGYDLLIEAWRPKTHLGDKVITRSNNDKHIYGHDAHLHCHPQNAGAFEKYYPGYAPEPEEEQIYEPLQRDTDVPLLPDWAHRAIADWATWLLYRNGNAAKQNRGLAYREAFERMLQRLRSASGDHVRNFFNIPR